MKWFAFILALFSGWAMAATGSTEAPVTSVTYDVQELRPPGDMELRNMVEPIQFEFSVRRDQVVTGARLHLVYTPSPTLLPAQSHIKVYLNDEMAGALPVASTQSGQQVEREITLDPRFITDFNRVRLELVGHYDDVCEDPLHSGLWVSISQRSTLQLTMQGLPLKSDLSDFPEPFFDARDVSPFTLPLVFAGTPDREEQHAAAIISSWFGARAGWRKQRYPVWEDKLPERHAVVFATNNDRPAFLTDYPPVTAPTIAVINHPDTHYLKLLLILGRDEADLVTAAKALALGSAALRGRAVEVDNVAITRAREPYDAPNWVRTDGPVTFRELMKYDQQLQASGLDPRLITLNVNVPPDLFTWRSEGIPLKLKYRYTPPLQKDESRLNVSINNRFIQALHLQESGVGGTSEQVRLPLFSRILQGDDGRLLIPAIQVGARNQLGFEFSFSSQSRGGVKDEVCTTLLPVDVRAAIDPDSSVDFSGYYHYRQMPDLQVFTSSGFPFSRMADLSQTRVLLPASPSRYQLELFFSLMAHMGAATGYPVTQVELAGKNESLASVDKDLLVIGDLPDALKTPALSARIERAFSQVVSPFSNAQADALATSSASLPEAAVNLVSDGALATIVGFQSPFAKQRSVVAMMASAPNDYRLISEALNNPQSVAGIKGSMAIVRDNRVDSFRVGERYYVGRLPWWLLLWYHLSGHPVILALLAALTVVLVVVALWSSLRWLAHRRLDEDEDSL